MTTTWSEWELEEEVGRIYQYRPVPKILRPASEMLPIDRAGHAEIKPHSHAGIRDGFVQLRRSKVSGPKILITYRPVDSGGKAVQTGRPAKVQVFATKLTDLTPAKLLSGATWWNLDGVPPPGSVLPTLDNPPLFGAAVEESVRNKFRDEVLAKNSPPHTMRLGVGGHRSGPDVLWDELAGMYQELARELRDPFYAEVAAELARA